GWTSVLVSIFFVSGLLFFNLGIIGFYIGKIFKEIKYHPLYLGKDSTFSSNINLKYFKGNRFYLSIYLSITTLDKRSYKIDTYQLTDAIDQALKETNNIHGHFTLKVDPLKNPKNFIETGFYYMDSLIEPVCKKNDFQFFENNKVS